MYESFIKLTLALFLGGFIGYERETKDMPAGLRTHILVCLGAALVQVISIRYYGTHAMQFDPMRLGAQVISGVGFLGAGAIIKDGMSAKGLTTAASIWVVACIGLAVGSGMYFEAIYSTALIYGALTILKGLDDKLKRKKQDK